MPPDIATRAPRAHRRLPARWFWWLWPAAIVTVAVIVAAAPRVFVDPPRIGHLSFENRTQYALEVEVTGAQRDGWLLLGTAERGATTVAPRVPDQGDAWIFHFESQGLDGGELPLSKDDLVRSGWRVVIPSAIGDRLASRGASPTPIHASE
jgi:hypothetical protein